MKVLHVTNNYPTLKHPIFGIFVKEQIESLEDLGIQNNILFINGREKGRIEYLKSIFKISKKLKNQKFDVIHCHHALSALCLIFSGAIKNNKVVVSFQNDPAHELGKSIYKLIRKNTHCWIFKNNSGLISDNRSYYLPNGVNTNFFKPMSKNEARKQLNLDKNVIYVLFVSSNKIRKQKRYDLFIETLEILKNKYGYHNIQEVKLTNMSREKIPLYFNAVDLHLLTSDFEGSPNSVKECMACNTPVVATNVGNVKELLDNVKGCYVSKTNNPKELAFIADKALKIESSNGTSKLKELQLDIKSVALKLKEIYTEIQ